MKKSLSPLLLLLFTICFANLSVSSQRSTHDRDLKRFQVGVLRTDGTIVPFAEYRNNIWWNPWPEIAESDPGNGPAPKSLTGHPAPWFESCLIANCTWYFWPSPDNRRILSSRKVVQVENHLDKNWALLTDMSDAAADKDGGHHKNIAFTLSGDLQLEGMKTIDIASKEASDAAGYVKSTFIHLETAEINRILAVPESKEFYQKNGLPFSQADRSKVELELTTLQRTSSTIDGRHLYYFEVEKKYPKPEGIPDWQCHNISDLRGWLFKDKASSFNITNETFWITDCDKKGTSHVVMSNVLRLEKRVFVFSVEHGWEDESYVIYELEEFGLKRLLETFGG